MPLAVAEAAMLPQQGKKEGSEHDTATPAWLQPFCFYAGPAGSAGFHRGRALCLSHLGRESTCTAQGLSGVSGCGMGCVGILCAAGTAWPVLLAHRKVSTFPGWGCAFPAVSRWLSTWAKAAGWGGQRQLRQRIWSLCRARHLRGAAAAAVARESKGMREWAFSLALKEPLKGLGFPASSAPAAGGSNAVQEWWEKKAALDLAPFLHVFAPLPACPTIPLSASGGIICGETTGEKRR